MSVSTNEVKLLLTAQDAISSVLNTVNASLGRLGSTAQSTKSPMEQFAAAAEHMGRSLSPAFVAGANGVASGISKAGSAAQGSSASFNTAASGIERAAAAVQSASPSFGTLTTSFTAGTLAANAISGAISTVVGAMENAAGATLTLASNLEQARIGFTTMLGSVEKADQFIGQLQQKAESTAFNFPGLQAVAQSFLAMGIDAKNVIPIIDDVSNALSAAGHGGDTAMLERVGQSLSEIAAQGKLSGEQIRELSRDGIAVLPLLAEAFGKTTAEVRKMAENGQISAEQFFAAFHSEVAMHYGDIQAQQAKTWAVAASNVQDILGRLSTQTFKELTDALTAGALALNDFLHSERFLQWAADVKASIHDVLTALAPLGATLRTAMGLPAEAPATPKAPPNTFAQANWQDTAIPPAALNSVDDYAAKIKTATADIHDTTAALTELSAQQQDARNKIEDTTKFWDAALAGLRAKQAANNAEIDATKTKYEAILAPLEKQSAALTRLGEDTKKSFATILDPLKLQLDAVNTKIADSKAAYEKVVTPIQREVDAINQANTALRAQRDLVVKIADIRLREQALAAEGDPKLRAQVAQQLKALDIEDQYLQIKKDQLDLGNKKGNNDKAIAAVQKQLDADRAKELGLQKQLLDAADKPLQAQIAGQEVLNKAQADGLKIAQDKADVAAQQKTAPLEAQLAAAKAQIQTLLDPLEAQAATLTKMIHDVSASEATALKPITDAQESVARKIQDTNQAMKDALAPLEAASKTISEQIAAAEAAKAAALAPLKDELDALDRKSNSLDLHKRQQADLVQGWKDEKAAIEAANAALAQHAPPLDLSGGKKPDEPPPALKGISAISPETIQSYRDLATNVQASADAFNNLNTATGGGLVGTIAELGKGLLVFAGLGLAESAILRVGAALASLRSPSTLARIAVAALILYITEHTPEIGAAWATVQKDWETFAAGQTKNWDSFKQDWGIFWHGIGQIPTTDGTSWQDVLSSGWDGWVQRETAKWETFKTTWTTFWGGVGKAVQAAFEPGWNAFTGFLQPKIDAVVKFFDPLLQAIKGIGDALGKLPQSLPGWMTGALGGGARTTNYVPSQGQGGSDIPPWLQQSSTDSADSDNAIAIITRTALKYGIDPRIAVALAKAESSLNPNAGNFNHESSIGLFQLNQAGGQGAGFSREQLSDPTFNAEKFLAAHAALYKQLVAEGLAGRELAETFGRLAEVSDPQFAYRYGDAYESLGVNFGTLNTQQQLADVSTVKLSQSQDAGQQAAAAAAAAHEKLGVIMDATATATDTTTQATQGQIVAQQDAIAHARALADQQHGLNTALTAEAPAAAKAAAGLQNISKAAQAVGTVIGGAATDIVKIFGGGGKPNGDQGGGKDKSTGGNGQTPLGQLSASFDQMQKAADDFWATFNKVEPKREAAWLDQWGIFTNTMTMDWQNVYDGMALATTTFWTVWAKEEPKREATVLEAWTAFTTSIGAAWTAAFTDVGTSTWADDFVKSLDTVQKAWDGLTQSLGQTNISQAAEQAFSGIPAATQPAVQAIKDVQNAAEDLYQYLSSHTFEVKISAPSGGDLPHFDTGGLVPGPVGAPQLAIVHGGERILTPGQSRSMLANASSRAVLSGQIGGGTTTIHAPVTIINNGTLVKQQDFEEVVSKAVAKNMRGGRFGK